MWDELGTILGLVIGCCLIVFRKKVVDFIIRKQLKEQATPKAEEYHRKVKETKFEGILHKVLEISSIVFGVFLILAGISEFFPPQATKYVIGLPVAAFFAAGVAAFVELKFIFHFLWKDVREYTRNHYRILHQSIQNSSGTDKINAASSEPTDDPILHALQRKAIIYSVICFIPLFLIILFAFCAIYRLTS